MRLPRVPYALGALMRALPAYPPAAAVAAALNVYAPDIFAEDERSRVEGRTVAIHLRDAGVRLVIRIGRRHYTACDARTSSDATISADARDFVLLAIRAADPDTLFFDRRLLMEGDTDLALILKNALERAAPPLPEPLCEFLRARLSA